MSKKRQSGKKRRGDKPTATPGEAPTAAADAPADTGEAQRARASKRRGSPSVMSFLSNLQSPREGAEGETPARGLLGDSSRADLLAAGGLDAGDPDVVETEPVTARVTRATEQGDFDERYADLEDADVDGQRGAPARELTRAALQHNRRSDRRPWSARVEIRGVFTSDLLDDALRAPRAGRVDDQPRAANLSLEGVFVETTSLLDVGDPVVLNLPSADGQPLSLPGRVRWVTPFGRLADARPGMGIEFVGVDENKRRRLEDLLRRLPRRPDGRA